MNDVIVALVIGILAATAQAILLLVIFRKAGFGLTHAVLSFAPLAGFAVQFLLILRGIVTPSEAALIALPLTLLPFLMLAFMSWPMATQQNNDPETIT